MRRAYEFHEGIQIGNRLRVLTTPGPRRLRSWNSLRSFCYILLSLGDGRGRGPAKLPAFLKEAAGVVAG